MNRVARTARTARLAALVTAVAVFAGGCVSNAKQDSLKPESHYAHTIFNLAVPVFAIAAVVLVIVVGGTLYFAARYRVRTDADLDGEEFPPQVHGNSTLELGWTIAPAAILLAVGIFTVFSIFNLAKVPPKSNPRVEVVGQQWWWEFRYDVNHDGKYNEVVTANQLVIPVNTDVAIKTVSRDVIHGFWAPQLNGKRDVVPGHPSAFNIAADKPGTYYGQCTVMCGLSHANMRLQVVALSKPDYEKWVVAQMKKAVTPASGLAKDGAALFKTQCGGCHNVTGVNKASPAKTPLTAGGLASGAAPNLTHLMSRTIFASGTYDLRVNSKRCIAMGLDYARDPKCIDDANLRAWLHDPQAMIPMVPNGINGKPGTLRGMPNLNLSTTQIDQLVAFLETLK